MSKKKITTAPKAIPLDALLTSPATARALKLERQFADNSPQLYEALIDLMADRAATGQKFKAGRKPGTGGQIRMAIRKALAKAPALRNKALWERIKSNPPRGFTFFETARFGRYIEGPHADDGMGYSRFCNVASEERKAAHEKLKP
jgi:hypothetical protein